MKISESKNLSSESVAKALPKMRTPDARKADDKNAPLSSGAIDIPQVVHEGSQGFGVKSSKVDVEA